MQPRNEKFFTLFSKAGFNVVESAAILMEFVAAPHERWADHGGTARGPGGAAHHVRGRDSSGAQRGLSGALAAQLHRLAAEVFTQGYVLAMRTMVMPIAVVALAAVSCLALGGKAGGQDRSAAPGAESGQMAGTISSPGSSGQSPGNSAGTSS
jgi:hypothetical protein